MARYERSFETLQEIRDSTRDLISRLDRVESRLDRLKFINKVRVDWRWIDSQD